MSQKKDAFAGDLKKFFKIYGNILYMSAVAQSVTNQTVAKNRKDLRDWVAAGKHVPENGLHEISTQMPLPNYVIDSEYVTYATQEMREASDEDLYRIMEEVGLRLQAQMLCEVFEALETFLKRSIITYFFQAKNDQVSFKTSFDGKFEAYWKNLKKDQPAKNTIPYFEKYVEWKRGDIWNFLNEFQKRLPFFSGKMGERLEALVSNTRDVEFCRHKIIHAHGQYDDEDLVPLSRRQRSNVKRMTRRSLLTGEPTILPSNDVIRILVEAFGGMAFLIYTGLVSSFDMKQDVQPHKKKTKK